MKATHKLPGDLEWMDDGEVIAKIQNILRATKYNKLWTAMIGNILKGPRYIEKKLSNDVC